MKITRVSDPMSTVAGVYGSLRSFCNSVAHRPVSTLAFLPHPQQRRVAAINEIDDAHIGLGEILHQPVCRSPAECARHRVKAH